MLEIRKFFGIFRTRVGRDFLSYKVKIQNKWKHEFEKEGEIPFNHPLTLIKKQNKKER